ncbi:hypothetical protein SDC9_72956 [bioreactor metagenome]|uniref:Thioesterase domain-containing protein n=1 Tax=bioreactor metagenome TaxID=1076179 RepID=A0A644YK10_9ZZZZ|nr:PaaI family thioesterase [Candidatus Metalachnospira sp.]
MEKVNSESSKSMLEELNKRIDKLRAYEIENSEELPMSIQMQPYLYDFFPENKTITIAFPVQKKQLNPNNAMIGGLITNAVDIACGLLIFAIDGFIIPPTITMTTNFINAIFFDDTLLIEAKVESWGKRIINISARGTSKNNGKTIVTSTSSFVSVESIKESLKK